MEEYEIIIGEDEVINEGEEITLEIKNLDTYEKLKARVIVDSNPREGWDILHVKRVPKAKKETKVITSPCGAVVSSMDVGISKLPIEKKYVKILGQIEEKVIVKKKETKRMGQMRGHMIRQMIERSKEE